MAKQFWIPSKDQAHMFKGLHSALVEAEAERAAGRRRATAVPRTAQLAGATIAAGIIFAAGYWCGSQSGSTTPAQQPTVARTVPLTHEQMIHAMRQPDGPRPAAQRAVAPSPAAQQPVAAQRHATARPVVANQGSPRQPSAPPGNAAQRPASAAVPRADMPRPMNVGRPMGTPQPDTQPHAAQPVRSAPPSSSLPQPGAGGFNPHAARAAAGGPATVGRPAPARTIPRSALPQPN